MKPSTAQMALEELKSIKKILDHDGDEWNLCTRLRESISAIEADLAAKVEPVIFTDVMIKTAYETQDDAYGYGAGAMAAMRKALSTLPILYAAPQQAEAPAGFVLVPVEPTPAMIVALMCTGLRHAEYEKGCEPTLAHMTQGYAAMIAAAPGSEK